MGGHTLLCHSGLGLGPYPVWGTKVGQAALFTKYERENGQEVEVQGYTDPGAQGDEASVQGPPSQEELDAAQAAVLGWGNHIRGLKEQHGKGNKDPEVQAAVASLKAWKERQAALQKRLDDELAAARAAFDDEDEEEEILLQLTASDQQPTFFKAEGPARFQDGEEEVSLSPELVEEAGGAAPAGFGQTSCLWSCGLPLSAKSVRSRLWLRVVGEEFGSLALPFLAKVYPALDKARTSDQGARPAKGKEYPGLGYKRLRDKPPKAQQQQQQQPAPKQINDIKDFLLTARRKDAKSVKIKKVAGRTKFKVRCSRYLYTLCVTDSDKADKLKQSLPPGALNKHDSTATFEEGSSAHTRSLCRKDAHAAYCSPVWFYDRDVSAALNIRRCAVGPGPRPTDLCYWDGRPAMPKPGRPGQEWVYLPDKALLRKWRRKWRQ
ncbi:hypothetical protein QJQ45_009547 [Haematococcus lacustris]|nr:hypothetical protein QJQ45_009547 [Haematococcus lacustris]